MLSNILDRISYISLFLVIVLLPVFFLPFTRIPVATSKGLLVVVGLAISVIFWAVARFSDGKVSFPRSPIILSGLGIVLAVLLSAFFSSASGMSFFGMIFDVGTFWFILAAFLLMFITSVMIKDNKSAQMLLFGAILSTVAVLVFQLIRFFLPAQLSLGVLGDNTDNLIGSLNSLGLLAGFSCLTSLFVLEFFSIKKTAKILFGFLILVSLFMMAAVNFMLVWVLVGVFSLFIFVYKISFLSKGEQDAKIKFPAFSFAIVMIALLFFMSGQFIGGFLPSKLGISNTEVSPSLGATMNVAGQALKKDPVFGIGPNRFSELWAMYKPQSINQTIFWDVSFNSGSGLLPTFASTTGILGILSWVTFFVFFIWAGIKSLFSSIRQNTHREVASFFVLALYLFLASFFYSVGPLIILLAFAFAGVFVGLLSNQPKGEVNISFLDDHRKSFFFILGLIVVMVLSAGITFKYVERFASVSYFGKAVQAATIPEAEAAITKALSLHANDLYLRTYSQVYMLRMSTLLNKEAELTEAEKAELQASFDQALNAAIAATQYNSKNYVNFQTLGNVYAAAGSLGVKDAYPKAIEAYQTALALNPLHPGIHLSMGQAYFADKKSTEAKAEVTKALELKPDYIDALLVMSQIEKQLGNNSSAISYAEQALALAPTNESLIEYVKSLKNGTATAPPTGTTTEDDN